MKKRGGKGEWCLASDKKVSKLEIVRHKYPTGTRRSHQIIPGIEL